MTEQPILFNGSDTFIKEKIISLTHKVLECKNVEEIISEYELGKLAELDNIHLQMALLQLSEEKFSGLIVSETNVFEMPKNGRFLRYIKAFIENQIPNFLKDINENHYIMPN